MAYMMCTHDLLESEIHDNILINSDISIETIYLRNLTSLDEPDEEPLPPTRALR